VSCGAQKRRGPVTDDTVNKGQKIATTFGKRRSSNRPPKLPQASHQQWTKRIGAAWQKGVEAFLETGRLLIEAKDALDHGEFEAMVRLKLPFDPSVARKLMVIARHPVLSNRAHAHVLPPSWTTLYELTKLPDETLLPKTKDGSINPKIERRQVTAMRPAPKARIKRSGANNTKKLSTVPPPMPTLVRDPVAPDEELALLREFARLFISERARITCDPKDRDECRIVFNRVKAMLGGAL
jgi:hypothetical protein